MKVPWRLIIIAVAAALLLTAGMIAWNNFQSDKTGGGENGESTDEEWATLEPLPEPTPVIPTATLPPLPTAIPAPTQTPVPLIDLYRDSSPIAGEYMEWVTLVETAAARAYEASAIAQREGTLSSLIKADQTARFAASLAKSRPPEVTGVLPGYNRSMNSLDVLTVFYGPEVSDMTHAHESLRDAASEICGTYTPHECQRKSEEMGIAQTIQNRMDGVDIRVDTETLLSGEKQYDDALVRQIEQDPIIQSSLRALAQEPRQETEALLQQATRLREELEVVAAHIIEQDQRE